MPVELRSDGRWRYREWVRLPDGSKERISGSAPKNNNTKHAARMALLKHIERVTHPERSETIDRKECPTVNDFAPIYLEVSRAKNKPSTAAMKETNLRMHILPFMGHLRLDEVSYEVIEDFKLALTKTPRRNVTRRKDGLMSTCKTTLSKKTIDNILTILRRMLVIARKRKLIVEVPDVEWFREPNGEIDFLTFGEADRLVAAATGEWSTMMFVALRTGLRFGELLGLRWQDVDLVAGKLRVVHSIVKGVEGTPKSGKPREVPLSPDAVKALRQHRHLRGKRVFCDEDGNVLRGPKARWAMESACKRAGLRQVGWHCLRHSFASHLAMRGAPVKAIQDLMGHATITMTMRYMHLSPSVSTDAVALLDQRDARGKIEEKSGSVTG